MNSEQRDKRLRFWYIFLVIALLLVVGTLITVDYNKEIWRVILNVSSPLFLIATALVSIYDLKKQQND
ncbi:MAG: hypothetical protein ACWA5P_03340 [bacterium]